MLTKVGKGLATIALIVGVSACAAAGQATSSTASAPTTAPAAANGSANQAGTPGASPARGTRAPNQAGTIQSVSGNTVTVQRPQNGGTFTVQLSGTTTIRKQATVAVADVKSGTPIFAVGQLSGTVLQARRIQLGTGQGGGPATGRANGGAGANGGNGGGANGGTAAPTVVNGTVDSVSGDTITVKAPDGTSTQVQLAANGQIIEQSTGSASDLISGKYLVAFGQAQNGTVTATAVSISDAPPVGGNGGAGPAQPASG